MTMINHYFELEKKYEKKYGAKTVVLYQCGGFFEIYGVENKDVKFGKIYEIADITNLSVSKRNSKYKPVTLSNPLMAGFPHHSFEKWKNILLKHGYTIIKIEQEAMGIKDPKRSITEIISPGTNLDETNQVSNNLMSIYIETIKSSTKNILYAGVSTIDVTTGENNIYEIESPKDDINYTLDEIFRIIQSYNPCEIIINTENLNYDKDYILSYLEIDTINIHYDSYSEMRHLISNKYKKLILEKSFPNTGMLSVVEYLDLEKKYFGLCSYIFLLQFTHEHNETIITKLLKPKVWDSKQHLILSYDSINQLNVIPNKNLRLNTKFDSLVSLLDHTSTSMGKRFLRDSILNPILNRDELNKRYDLVDIFLKEHDEKRIYQIISDNLEKVFDIERLHRKMTVKLLEPCQFASLDISYQHIIKVIENIEKLGDEKLNQILPDSNTIDEFKKFINDYNSKLDMENINRYNRNNMKKSIFKKGVYEEIDKIGDKIEYYNDFFTAFGKYMGETIGLNDGIPVKETDRDGHFFSTTKKRAKTFKDIVTKKTKIKIGAEKISISTSTLEFKTSSSVTKVFCPEIRNYSERLNFYHTKMMKKSLEKFSEMLQNYDLKYNSVLKKIVKFVAYLDFVKSNAKTAFKYQYTRPKITDKLKGKSYINCKSVRHPIIERINTKLEYIPNDIKLGMDINGMLLYGVNAVGKSSYMKSVGLALIMSQSGLFVPAESFEFFPYKYIFTRISGNDNIFKGQSTFAVEMSELRSILKRANENSLILGDELCSGTETISGLSIVAAGVLTLEKFKSSFIFATHLHQLSKMDRLNKLETVKNFHMETKYDNISGKLIYNRKIKPGSGNAIYGLEVAKAMDLNPQFIKLANTIRQEVLGVETSIVSKKTSQYNSKVIVDECKICGKKAEEVHHMKPQAIADKDGVIDHHHKNAQHNLIPLCHDCHQGAENGDLEIVGYIQTTDGIEVNHKKLVKNELEKKKGAKKKYGAEQIKLVLKYKPDEGQKGNYTRTRQLLELNDDLKISTSIIKKIWNGRY